MITRPRNLQQADPYFDSVSLLAPLSGEDAATSASDLSNNAHTITFNGNSVLDGDIRKFGFASCKFDGTEDGLTIADDASLTFGSGDFTMECHVRFNGTQTATGNVDTHKGVWMSKWTNGTGTAEWVWGWRSDGNIYWTYSVNGTNSVDLNVQTSYSPPADQWIHFAVCRSGTTVYHYIDGVMSGSGSMGTNTIYDSATEVRISGYGNAGTLREEFDGWVENVRITKGVARYPGGTTFTPPERAYPTVKGQNPVTDGLMINLDPSSPASYPGSGTTIYDLSPNDNDGTLVGSPTISGGIIQMDGIDDSISFTSIDISHTDKVSIDFWCKLNTYVETDATVDAVVFEMTPNYNSSTVGFAATTADDSVGGYNNTFPVSVNLKGNIGYNAHGYNKTLVNDLAWHHWCCIYDKSVSGTNPIEGRLYIDGIEQSVSQFPTASVRQDNTNNFGNVAFYIGSRANTVANIDADWGSIRLYDRVLTDGEVRQNFEAHRNRYGV